MTVLNLRRLENDQAVAFNLNHASTDRSSFVSQSKIPPVKVVFDWNHEVIKKRNGTQNTVNECNFNQSNVDREIMF